MRAMVSPVFTSGKLKLMVPHIVKCGLNIEEHLKTASMTGRSWRPGRCMASSLWTLSRPQDLVLSPTATKILRTSSESML